MDSLFHGLMFISGSIGCMCLKSQLSPPLYVSARVQGKCYEKGSEFVCISVDSNLNCTSMIHTVFLIPQSLPNNYQSNSLSLNYPIL